MRLIVTVMILIMPAIAGGQEKKNKFDRRREVDLKAGDMAPDFTLRDADGKNQVKLSDLKGKPVVLIFGSCT